MKNLDTDVVIIGSGVIGISIAYFLSKEGKKVILLEKEKNFGMGSSSRNTEVIHAGVYYAKDSLKSKLCLVGKKMMYNFCAKNSIPHKKIGKLFIALNSEEITHLEKIKLQAEANGLKDLKYLNKNKILEIEPALRCDMAILSPSSGIVDSYSFMQSLLRFGQDKGVIFSANSPFLGADFNSNFWKVYVGGKNTTELKCKIIINASGLNATEISNKVKSNKQIPLPNPIKGIYLRYSGKSPINHIVYPSLIPGKIEERVDATPDLNNVLRFGPSVEKEKISNVDDYSANSEIKNRFSSQIKKYLPKLDVDKLHLDLVGIRPKVIMKNNTVPDFMFEWGVKQGWLDLWNMESPGLTASLAIGDYVNNKIIKSRLI